MNQSKKNKENINNLNEDILEYDIFSPFIDKFIQYNNEIFIRIPLNYIEKYDLKNDYKSFFLKNYNNINLLYIYMMMILIK